MKYDNKTHFLEISEFETSDVTTINEFLENLPHKVLSAQYQIHTNGSTWVMLVYAVPKLPIK